MEKQKRLVTLTISFNTDNADVYVDLIQERKIAKKELLRLLGETISGESMLVETVFINDLSIHKDPLPLD